MEFGHSDDGKRKRRVDQKKKAKLRHSREWKNLKNRLIAERGMIDELTMRLLDAEEKVTCHHMNLNAEEYGEFSKDDDFMLLSESSHKAVHWLWHITKGVDFSILDRIREILERMKELTDEDSRTRHVSDSHWRSEDDSRPELRDRID